MFKAQPLDITANRGSINSPPLAANHHPVRTIGPAKHEPAASPMTWNSQRIFEPDARHFTFSLFLG